VQNSNNFLLRRVHKQGNNIILDTAGAAHLPQLLSDSDLIYGRVLEIRKYFSGHLPNDI
jgi:hypothetical protein